MNYFQILFFSTLSFLANAQQEHISYTYNDYLVQVSDSLLTVIHPKLNTVDTVFSDQAKAYYITKEGAEISKLDMEKLQYGNPQKYSNIDSIDDLYISKENSYMLSIVGPYISYAYEFYIDGGAHPSYGKYYLSYNIETKKRFNLSDFFSDEEVYLALIKNEFILNYVKPNKAANLEQLLGGFFMNAGCDYSLDLSSFSFGKTENNQVTIFIGVAYGCEASRGNFELISVQLKIPEKLKQPLEISSEAHLLDTD